MQRFRCASERTGALWDVKISQYYNLGMIASLAKAIGQVVCAEILRADLCYVGWDLSRDLFDGWG